MAQGVKIFTIQTAIRILVLLVSMPEIGHTANATTQRLAEAGTQEQALQQKPRELEESLVE